MICEKTVEKYLKYAVTVTIVVELENEVDRRAGTNSRKIPISVFYRAMKVILQPIMECGIINIIMEREEYGKQILFPVIVSNRCDILEQKNNFYVKQKCRNETM